jgi:Serine kinase of the HPr protein, regulates carbohydrate metabolism
LSYYYHKAYGLIFCSELNLTELTTISESNTYDVQVCFGQSPESLHPSLINHPWYQASQREFLLKINGIADFYVRNGDTVIISRNSNTSNDDIRAFLYYSIIPQLLNQRGLIALHGTAIIKNERAVLLSGISSVGKSALALGLIRQGWQLISDEVCILGNDNKILPGISYLSIWKDTIDNLKHTSAMLSKIRDDLEKYYCSTDIYDRPVPISKVIILKNTNNPDSMLHPLKGVDKFKEFLLCLLQKNTLDLTYKINSYHMITNLISNADMCEMYICSENKYLKQNIDFLEKELSKDE